MHIKKIISQHRRDLVVVYECEHCGHTFQGSGYDDTNFHNNTVPTFKCEKCKKTADESYRPLTHSRVTKGGVYKVEEDGHIKDDKGASMKPCMKIEGYWEEVDLGVHSRKWPDNPTPKAGTTKRPHNDMFQPESIGTYYRKSGKFQYAKYKMSNRERYEGVKLHNYQKQSIASAINIEAIRRAVEEVYGTDRVSVVNDEILIKSLDPVTGEFKMNETSKTIVETVTLINDQRADNYSIHEILNLIEKEEKNLARLEGVQAKSKAIDKLKTRHQETIAALVAVLDSRE